MPRRLAALPIRLCCVLALAPAAAADTLPDPAAAPPAPALLGATPGPASPAAPPLALELPGLERLPQGGWRVAGTALPPSLAALGQALAEAVPEGRGRVTLVAEVATPPDDPSTARRESLARAVAVRGALERGGLPATRMDIRPLGRTAAARDVVDILPPGAPR
jgi:hypothetical protein